MLLIIILLLTTFFLAYSNGANDNFKGVATLYGSGVLSYPWAIGLATLATLLGSLTAIFLAQELVHHFSGKGLVPQDTAAAMDFLIAVGLGAACTVLLATLLGYPISTTHSLVGGLLGAGIMAVGVDVNFARLGSVFLLPLLVSPFIAFLLGYLLYRLFTHYRKQLGLNKETCICIGEDRQFVPVSHLNHMNLEASKINMIIADAAECADHYTDKVWGISLQWMLDRAHIASAAAVSFARGLNDTPKIAGLILLIEGLNIQWGIVAIAVGIALGGLLSARKVARTISKKITRINHGQGFSANLVTAFLVIVASKFGIPVSTTHVSVGSIFGISTVNQERDNRVIKNILLSWIITLPTAMLFSAVVYLLIP